MSGPIEHLELQALEQRNQLHRTADDLRAWIEAGREKLRFSQKAREHFALASGMACLIAMGLGYSAGGMLTSRR